MRYDGKPFCWCSPEQVGQFAPTAHEPQHSAFISISGPGPVSGRQNILSIGSNGHSWAFRLTCVTKAEHVVPYKRCENFINHHGCHFRCFQHSRPSAPSSYVFF